MAGKIYSQFSLTVSPANYPTWLLVPSYYAKNQKYSFMSFVSLFEVGSAICGAAQSSNMLIIGRAVAGIGGSGIQNGALTMVSAAVPLQKRGGMIQSLPKNE